MNYWLIAIMVCSIALAVGPVMLFKPSARDRRLANLRQLAAEKGIRVRLVPAKSSPIDGNVAVYSIPLSEKESSRKEWLLLQQKITHELHFQQRWDWDKKEDSVSEKHHQAIKLILSNLDNSIVGLEKTPNSVGVWWSEKSLTVDDVKRVLEDLLQLV